MASSDVSAVVNYFATANEGFTTTLGSTIASAATTVPLNSVTGLTNATVFVGIIEPGLTNQQVFTGTVDTGGSQITGVKWTRGTNATHATGVTIVDYVTGTARNMMTTGILKQHSQTGAHTAITGTSINLTSTATVDTIAEKTAANGVTIDGLNIKDSLLNTNNSVPALALATNAITLGYAEITSPFSTTSASVVQVTGLTVTVTIPAGGRKVKITVYCPYVTNSGASFISTVSIWDGAVGGTGIGSSLTWAAQNNYGTPVTALAVVTPSAGSKTYNVGLNVTGGGTSTMNAASGGPSFILVEAI